MVAEGERAVDEPIVVDGTEYRMTCISMGNPHAIVYVDDVKNLPIEKIVHHLKSMKDFQTA